MQGRSDPPQKATTGDVDWGRVGIDAAIGGVTGAAPINPPMPAAGTRAERLMNNHVMAPNVQRFNTAVDVGVDRVTGFAQGATNEYLRPGSSGELSDVFWGGMRGATTGPHGPTVGVHRGWGF